MTLPKLTHPRSQFFHRPLISQLSIVVHLFPRSSIPYLNAAAAFFFSFFLVFIAAHSLSPSRQIKLIEKPQYFCFRTFNSAVSLLRGSTIQPSNLSPGACSSALIFTRLSFEIIVVDPLINVATFERANKNSRSPVIRTSLLLISH